MSTQIRFRRGSTAQHAAFTGALAEVTVDTDKKTVVVHDGGTAGGFPLAREDGKNDGALGFQQDVKTGDYTVLVGDIGKALVANKATAINFPLSAAAALTSKFVALFKNIGVGTLTITPNGAELIDGVNAAISVQTGASLILKGDGSSFRTYVSNGDVTAAAIHNAASKTVLADNDEIGIIDSAASNVLKKILFSNFISSIFTVARTIANAQFASATFKLFNAAGTPRALSFVTTALTADRTLTLPDANVDLSNTLKGAAPVTLNGVGAFTDFLSIPAGTKRITVMWAALSTNGTSGLGIQIGPSGGPETSGYASTSGGTLSTTHFLLVDALAAAGVYHGIAVLALIDASTNTWVCSTSAGRTDTAASLVGAGSKSIAGSISQLRFKPINGTDLFDAGKANILYE